MPAELTLYRIEEDLQALLDTQEMAEGEEQQLAVLQAITEANQAAVEKRDSVIRFLRFLDLQQDAIDAEIARLRALKENYEKGRQRLERYVLSVLDQLPEPKRGAKKLEGSIGVLALRKNPSRVDITEPEEVPDEFCEVVLAMPATEWRRLHWQLTSARVTMRRARLKDVKAAIESGQQVSGADLKIGSNRLEVK